MDNGIVMGSQGSPYSNEHPILNEIEYNALDKVLIKSHMGDFLLLIQKEYYGKVQDMFYDMEEERQLTFKEGLEIIKDGYQNEGNIYRLTEEELASLNSLFQRVLGEPL